MSKKIEELEAELEICNLKLSNIKEDLKQEEKVKKSIEKDILNLKLFQIFESFPWIEKDVYLEFVDITEKDKILVFNKTTGDKKIECMIDMITDSIFYNDPFTILDKIDYCKKSYYISIYMGFDYIGFQVVNHSQTKFIDNVTILLIFCDRYNIPVDKTNLIKWSK